MTLHAMRTFFGPSLVYRAEFLRALMLISVIRPVSKFLWGIFLRPLAFLLSLPLTLTTPQGRRTIRAFASDYDRTWLGGLGMALRSHANKLVEFGDMQRLIDKSVRVGKYRITIEASDEIRRLLESDASLVCTGAHFVRGVSMGVASLHPTFQRPVHYVVAQPPAVATDAYRWRIQLMLCQVINSLRAARPDAKFVFTGGAFSTLVDDLRAQRSIVCINVDAPWSANRPSSYQRPFAGAASRTFSTGAAKLARLSGCPLLFIMPVLERGKHVRVHVAGPFTSSEQDPEKHDIDLTHQVLDHVEREVGRRPTEYILDVGAERRWDATQNRWVERHV